MYQIFISYRRDGGFETAKHLYDLLKADGFVVSFDIDTLREGSFDKELLNRIEECEDFILIVDKKCFDRTLDPSFNRDWDWLRQELSYALYLGKNIIPILLADARFPAGLPEDIRDVTFRNGPAYSKAYFDAFYAKLKSFLHSARRNDATVSYRAPVRPEPAHHASVQGATVTFYAQVPCRVEERGQCLAEVPPGSIGADVVLRKGRHRLFFINPEDPSQNYSQEYVVEDIEATDYIDISFQPAEEEEEPETSAEELYEKGQLLDQEEDFEKSTECYKAAAELGHAGAQFELGQNYACGLGVEENPEEAFKWYKKAAEQGHPEAQYRLAIAYDFGNGVRKNSKEAIKWYLKAAEQGLPGAQCDLAISFVNGDGVEQDIAQAIKWYRKAAEQGFAKAQNNLGMCYLLGDGVKENEKEAYKWFSLAAGQDYPLAQFNLGSSYKFGWGVPQNAKKAAEWFKKAAEQGNADAQYELGLCYFFGDGVQRNEKEAAKWFLKAAEQDHPEGQYRIGKCYELGIGVPTSSRKAKEWLQKAADNENEDAKRALYGI